MNKKERIDQKTRHITEQITSLKRRENGIVINGPELSIKQAIQLQERRLRILNWCKRNSQEKIMERFLQLTPRDSFETSKQFLEQCEYELLAYVLGVM